MCRVPTPDGSELEMATSLGLPESGLGMRGAVVQLWLPKALLSPFEPVPDAGVPEPEDGDQVPEEEALPHQADGERLRPAPGLSPAWGPRRRGVPGGEGRPGPAPSQKDGLRGRLAKPCQDSGGGARCASGPLPPRDEDACVCVCARVCHFVDFLILTLMHFFSCFVPKDWFLHLGPAVRRVGIDPELFFFGGGVSLRAVFSTQLLGTPNGLGAPLWAKSHWGNTLPRTHRDTIVCSEGGGQTNNGKGPLGHLKDEAAFGTEGLGIKS